MYRNQLMSQKLGRSSGLFANVGVSITYSLSIKSINALNSAGVSSTLMLLSIQFYYRFVAFVNKA